MVWILSNLAKNSWVQSPLEQHHKIEKKKKEEKKQKKKANAIDPALYSPYTLVMSLNLVLS